MQIRILHTGFLKVRPKVMFNHLKPERVSPYYETDHQGSMRISMNTLLVAEGDQVVLFDPGCADFLPSRLVDSYGLYMQESMEKVLGNAGFKPEQITDVIFTHLHFDHGSGAFKRVPGNIEKRFPAAKYHVLKKHFEYASSPGTKESNSFFTNLIKYVDKIYWLEDWEHGWMEFQVFNGHTRGLIVPKILSSEMDTYFVSDLIPMEIFMEPDVNSGYDLDPGLALTEKLDFLNDLKGPSRLILFHDPVNEEKIYR